MGIFYLMTKSGTKPPKYVHHTLQSAVTEAERLHKLLKCEVLILEIVGKVFSEIVPVTETRMRTVLNERKDEQDDLPF